VKINFRQGIVSYQSGGFLSINGSGNVDLLATNRPVTVTIAQSDTNYIFVENSSVTDAWVGPFSSSTNYWLYWEFSLFDFTRTFNTTTLEPVAQALEPGSGDATVVDVTPGAAGIGAFVVYSNYALQAGRTFDIYGSTGNDGTYTVVSTSYNMFSGETTINVAEAVPSAVVDGSATLDVDSSGVPLKQTGRIWYNTQTNKHYIRQAFGWQEILCVFAALLTNGNYFLSPSINGGSSFVGTQVGDNTSVYAGRALFDSSSAPLKRADGTFFTTEDAFYSSASRVDGIRLESNVSFAQSSNGTIMAKFTPVAYMADGKIRSAVYNDSQDTVVGMLVDDILPGEVGSVILQGVITNANWTWSTIGAPLWIESGALTETDPHVADAISYPTPKTPVARVLSSDTIIFEQGLGGVGPRGATGSIADLPPATTAYIGGVTLVTASSDPAKAFVVSDTDPRLTDARTPLSHQHPASQIIVTPVGSITSADGQSAFAELDTKKLALAGGTLTGTLTLNADPTTALEAATKQYADTKLSLSGGTLTGSLTLNADPTVALEAATKQYADTKLSLSGGVLTGTLTLNADPTSALEAATKQYVDNAVPATIPYDVNAQGVGALSDTTVIGRLVATRAFTVDSVGHVGLAQTAPVTTAAVFTVYKSTGAGPLSSIGTITFAAASQIQTSVAFASPVTFNIGDVVTIECTTASSIADVTLTLSASI